MNIFNTLLYQPILNTLLFINHYTPNLGIAIIVLTLAIRFILLPLTLPALKTQAKMKELQPELNKLKDQYKDDKTKLQQAQLELYQKHQINPAAGCLPYLLQFAVLIALYRVFIDFLGAGHQGVIPQLLWFTMGEPDPLHILPIIAGLTQLVLAIMIAPATDTSAEQVLAKSTPTKKDDQKADSMQDMATAMQQQMLVVMPLMTAFLAWNFPSGLSLYWIVSTVFSAVQQYFISGWGAFPRYFKLVSSKLAHK